MNILAIRNDKIGDFVVSLPAIYIIKKNFPNAKLYVCISPINQSLAKNLDFIDGIILYDKNNFFKLYKDIKKAKIDLAISFFSDFSVGLALFLNFIKIRIAPATKIAQIFYNKRIKQRRSKVKMSECEYNIELAKAIKKDMDTTYPIPFFKFKNSKEIFKKFLKSLDIDINKKIIAIHTGFGGSSNANLNLNNYINIAKMISKMQEYQVVFTFSKDEYHLKKEIQAKCLNENIKYYTSKNNIYSFAKLISNFFMFISTSTGTYHLASASNIYTLTFFASDLFSSFKRWKSIGSKTKQIAYMLPYDKTREKFIKDMIKDLEVFLLKHKN